MSEWLLSKRQKIVSAAAAAAAAAKSLQLCPTLCDLIDGSPLGSPSLGFSRQEHWSGLPFPSPMRESEKWKWSRSVVSDSQRPHGLHAAYQAPPSMGFSRQEYWSGVPLPSPMHESEQWKWSRSVVSDSSRPHGLHPTRLLHPWESPGRSTGVGCPHLVRMWQKGTLYKLQWCCSR